MLLSCLEKVNFELKSINDTKIIYIFAKNQKTSGKMYVLNPDELSFPDPRDGNDEGLIAIGGDLSPERLLFAYSIGLFPWFNDDEPILWWSPNPRFVLFPDELKIAKSMRPYFNQQKFVTTYDTCFEEVIQKCSKMNRRGQDGTWITKDMIEAYTLLHQLGYAHSIEVWNPQKKLVGGLYGISLGKVFYGESMFALESNASKFGFISLITQLKKLNFKLIDCQQQTQHLESLGAKTIDRAYFMELLNIYTREHTLVGNWNDLLAAV
jgi:leucyl/phenylalanyl-tRNA---protein transferase